MAEQRMTYWAAEAGVDEDLEDVDLNLAIGSFGQTDIYEDGVSKSRNYTADSVTKTLRWPSEAKHRRDYNTRRAAANGTTSFRSNPGRCEEGMCAGVFSREIPYRATTATVHRTLLPSGTGE